MTLRVTFELGDDDLRYFRRVMREARTAARETPEKEIVAAARKLLRQVRSGRAPGFVLERLLQLEPMIAMLEDEEWGLAGSDRERVVSALAYLNDPHDLIPDHVPGIGFIDDAIMVELLVQDLRPELEAYADFGAHRRAEELRLGRRASIDRETWLAARRRQLHARMRRRRRARGRRRSDDGPTRNPFSLF
jgi:uncharacterized membrane protein YkvA (DUF1232 family)